jgi:formate dehydrogenase subunit gamma
MAPAELRQTSSKVLRFRASERRVHWSIAIPFLLCYTTALVLVVYYNPDPQRPYRELFSWAHRISGLALIVFPALAMARSAGDLRTHFRNIAQAWLWVLDDVKWLALMGFAAISRRIKLPEQGKFNAAQKLNFMLVMSTYPLYIATGLTMWLTGAAILPWLLHFGMAIIATPFLAGHIFMATIPRSSRKALQGMFSGLVDREWAKHHHRRWYRENFEHQAEPPAAASSHAVPTGGNGARNGDRQVVLPSARRRNGSPASATTPPPRAAAQRREPHPGIAWLESVQTSRPDVLHASLVHWHGGDEAAGVRFGLSMLEYCVYENKTRLAADLFRALWPHMRDADLDGAALRGIVNHLQRAGDVTTAVKASALLLLREANDPVAVGCLMKAAEAKQKQNDGREDARRIYAFLLKHCGGSPYIGYFRKGLDETRGIA